MIVRPCLNLSSDFFQRGVVRNDLWVVLDSIPSHPRKGDFLPTLVTPPQVMFTFIVSPCNQLYKLNLSFSVIREEPSTFPVTEGEAQDAILFASQSDIEASIVIGVRLTRPQATHLLMKRDFLKALLDLVGDTKSED